jgi:GR25 family glycosyltransferase involved in LPS biosynthesis
MIKTQAYVITILDNPKSVEVADRCIISAEQQNIECHRWPATTPKNNIYGLYEKEGIPVAGFVEVYSRIENCMSAFFSHYRLWHHCVELNHEITIFEHDAIVVDRIPDFINFKGCINLGKPSYGKYNTPKKLGVNPLTSKRYFPGAHAYRINPVGAKMLIAQAKVVAMTTDVYLDINTFPWLEEYYPWPAEAKDTFTTIQNTKGCLAKHGYNEAYEII